MPEVINNGNEKVFKIKRISFFQVLDVLCSLCVCHGVAVRSNQHLICDNLLPGRDLLLQTRLVNHVSRYKEKEKNLYEQSNKPNLCLKEIVTTENLFYFQNFCYDILFLLGF